MTFLPILDLFSKLLAIKEEFYLSALLGNRKLRLILHGILKEILPEVASRAPPRNVKVFRDFFRIYSKQFSNDISKKYLLFRINYSKYSLYNPPRNSSKYSSKDFKRHSHPLKNSSREFFKCFFEE